MIGGPRAQARIDLDAIQHNLALLRAAAPRAQQMAVVKADAYGHGLLPCARAAREAGADWLGVALFAEALQLRAAGDRGPILAWLAVPDDPWEEVIAEHVDVGVSGIGALERVATAAAACGTRARVHLKIDTGLGRAGCPAPDWADFVRMALRWKAGGRIDVVGIWSHFTVADAPDDRLNTVQVQRFEAAVAEAESLGLSVPLRHLANSAATLALPGAHFDLVRPGIAVYGLSPGAGVGTSSGLGLRPAMRLAARLMVVKRLPAGSGLSYGHIYHLSEDATVAVVPLGYADGIPRAASNCGPVAVAGHRTCVAGRVCMDQFMLDLGNRPVAEGDEVVLFGGGAGDPSAEDWATATGTIGYEIVTRIGPRVPRVYVGGRR